MDGWKDTWVDDGWMDIWVMDGWTGGRMDGQVDGWMMNR